MFRFLVIALLVAMTQAYAGARGRPHRQTIRSDAARPRVHVSFAALHTLARHFIYAHELTHVPLLRLLLQARRC